MGNHQPRASPGPQLRFLFTEKHLGGCSTDGAGPLHSGLAILHRHLLRVLHFRLLLAPHAVRLSHQSYPFSTENMLGERACSLAPHCSTEVLRMQEHAPRAVQASKMIGPPASPVIIARDAARSPRLGDVLQGAAGETSPGR